MFQPGTDHANHSFTNEYSYGDFKGDPDAWMEKYFDGFLYWANWGSRQLQLAFPAALLQEKLAQQYCCCDAASVCKKSGRLILKFAREGESDETYFEGESQLAAMMQVRNELAQGDLRSLYLG